MGGGRPEWGHSDLSLPPLQGLWFHGCKVIMTTPPWTLLIPSVHSSVRQGVMISGCENGVLPWHVQQVPFREQVRLSSCCRCETWRVPVCPEA